MWETKTVGLEVQLPTEMADHVAEIQAEDPTYFSRAILYAITKRRLNVTRVPSDNPPMEEDSQE